MFDENGNLIDNPQNGDVGFQDPEGDAKHYFRNGKWVSENTVWMIL